MFKERYKPLLEQPKQITAGALVGALVTDNLSETFLPQELKSNKELQEKCADRFELSKIVDAVFAKMPKASTTITEALSEGLVAPDVVSKMYKQVTKLLVEDPASARLLLYFPFELLPSKSFQEEDLCAREFVMVYKQVWKGLLKQKDIRADFDNGDIPELEIRDELPLVVKATHLIPWLVKAEFYAPEEIFTIIELQEDDISLEGIADALVAMVDMGIVTEQFLAQLNQSKHLLIRNTGKIMRSRIEYVTKTQSIEEPGSLTEITSSLLSGIEEGKKKVIRRGENMTASRISWLNETTRESVLTSHSESLSVSLASGVVTSADLVAYLNRDSVSSDEVCLIVYALRSRICTQLQSDVEIGEAEYKKYLNIFNSIKNINDRSVQESLQRTFRYFSALGLTDPEMFNTYDISMPRFTTSKEDVIYESFHEGSIKKLVSGIESQEELKKYVYPVLVTLGSHMKGYARADSDIDVGIFVRPDAMFTDRVRIQGLIKEIFTRESINGSAMEFWLKNDGDSLSIRDFENPDSSLGDSSLTHPLLGSWSGDKEAIHELYKKLIPGYFFSKGKRILEHDARTVWLKDMEHNMLQYRLMHKGYQNFLPLQGRESTQHFDTIDGNSTFYDPGYRRLATRMYINKVFLPQLN